MLTGIVNAKRDFPVDYPQYFRDDTDVMLSFRDGNIKAFCEPWNPPGVIGQVHYVYTLKTAFTSEDASFMLGSFELINDIVLDTNDEEIIVPYNAISQLPSLGTDILHSDTWFREAFQALPLGLCLTDLNGAVVLANNYWNRLAHLVSVDVAQYRSDFNPLISAVWLPRNSTTGHGLGMYHIQMDDGILYRVWVLRPSMAVTADPYYIDGKLSTRS
eukprot:gene8787-9689_t